MTSTLKRRRGSRWGNRKWEMCRYRILWLVNGGFRWWAWQRSFRITVTTHAPKRTTSRWWSCSSRSPSPGPSGQLPSGPVRSQCSGSAPSQAGAPLARVRHEIVHVVMSVLLSMTSIAKYLPSLSSQTFVQMVLASTDSRRWMSLCCPLMFVIVTTLAEFAHPCFVQEMRKAELTPVR